MPLKYTVSTYESGKGRALCGRRILDVDVLKQTKRLSSRFWNFLLAFCNKNYVTGKSLMGPMGWSRTLIAEVQSYARMYVVCSSNVRSQRNSVSKNTSVERSKTGEKVNLSKFNQRFFWLVQPFITLTRKHHTAPCFMPVFINDVPSWRSIGSPVQRF